MLSLLLRYFYNSSHCYCHCSVVVVIVGSVTIAVLVSFIVFVFVESKRPGGLSPGGGIRPYIGYSGVCRWKGYGFQAIYSGIRPSNHRTLI